MIFKDQKIALKNSYLFFNAIFLNLTFF